MKKLLLLMCTMFALTANASAQGCPGGFWGNGQCIAPCESPLVNSNISLSFYGYQCSAQPPCENNYVYCYPSYTAWDNAYQQYCGVIIDWNDGGCTPGAPLNLNRVAPKRRALEDELSISLRRPVDFRIRQIQIKSRFWWKHASHKFLL